MMQNASSPSDQVKKFHYYQLPFPLLWKTKNKI